MTPKKHEEDEENGNGKKEQKPLHHQKPTLERTITKISFI
jgi:hypothetical protein